MKKLFISQPMHDRSDEEIFKERNRIIAMVRASQDDDIEVIESVFDYHPENRPPLYYLSQALARLSTADIVAFGEGWQDYRGCRIEHECAVQYDIPIVLD